MRVTLTAGFVACFIIVGCSSPQAKKDQSAKAPKTTYIDMAKTNSLFEKNRNHFVIVTERAALDCDVIASKDSSADEVIAARTRLNRLRLSVEKTQQEIKTMVKVPRNGGFELVNYAVVADNRRARQVIGSTLHAVMNQTAPLENPFKAGRDAKGIRLWTADTSAQLRQYAQWMRASSAGDWHRQPAENIKRTTGKVPALEVIRK